jgi:hypothetical protein
MGIAEDIFFYIRIGVAHRAPDAVPKAIMPAAHHHVTVFARIDRVDVDGQVPVAEARTDAAIH